MAMGPGVSSDQLPSGRWRVRWRETVQEPDGKVRRVQRSLVVEDQATAIAVQAKVLRALESGELYEREAVREIPEVASLDAVMAGWLEARAAYGVDKATLTTYGGYITRILRTFRELGRVPEGVAVPGTLLTRDRVVEATNAMRVGKISASTVRATIRALVSAWSWAADDPAEYPGLAAPPRDPKRIVPRPVVYSPPPAATMEECDAILRRLDDLHHSTIALPATVIARCTGLRIGQILEIRAEDLNLRARTLTVTAGKSQREKAERRTIPIAPVLAEYLMPWVARREDDPTAFLLTRRSDLTRGKGRKPDGTLKRVWEDATKAGEVREAVWKPPGRGSARPDHAFRAAFQAYLVRKGVRDEVIDALVGHAGGLRERHYVNSLEERWDAMVEAVALIPPIAWKKEEMPDNVVPLNRG
jgi:integrase